MQINFLSRFDSVNPSKNTFSLGLDLQIALKDGYIWVTMNTGNVNE